MKTVNRVGKNIRSISIFVALAMAVSLSTGSSQEKMKPMKGAEHLQMLGVNTKEQVDALKTGDSVAMVCAKCKTVWVSRVKQGVKGAQLLTENGQPTELIGTHACKGCNSTLTTTGGPKGGLTELKHSCKACGDDSAFCCATKPGSGPTKGMEKK